MPRRVSKKTPSIFAPAGDLVKRITDADSRSRKRMVTIVSWIIGLGFFWTLVSGDYSLFNIWKLRAEKEALRAANRQLVTNLIDADRTRMLLRGDPGYIEFVARAQYHMVFPNETIYRYR